MARMDNHCSATPSPTKKKTGCCCLTPTLVSLFLLSFHPSVFRVLRISSASSALYHPFICPFFLSPPGTCLLLSSLIYPPDSLPLPLYILYIFISQSILLIHSSPFFRSTVWQGTDCQAQQYWQPAGTESLVGNIFFFYS